jgi:hypothetical protein
MSGGWPRRAAVTAFSEDEFQFCSGDECESGAGGIREDGNDPAGAKARFILQVFSARLKSCPDTKHNVSSPERRT